MYIYIYTYILPVKATGKKRLADLHADFDVYSELNDSNVRERYRCKEVQYITINCFEAITASASISTHRC